jgi:hypothetical protein
LDGDSGQLRWSSGYHNRHEHHDRYDYWNDRHHGYHYEHDEHHHGYDNHWHYHRREPDREPECIRERIRESNRRYDTENDEHHHRYDGYRYPHYGYLNWDDNRSEHHRSGDQR